LLFSLFLYDSLSLLLHFMIHFFLPVLGTWLSISFLVKFLTMEYWATLAYTRMYTFLCMNFFMFYAFVIPFWFLLKYCLWFFYRYFEVPYLCLVCFHECNVFYLIYTMLVNLHVCLWRNLSECTLRISELSTCVKTPCHINMYIYSLFGCIHNHS